MARKRTVAYLDADGKLLAVRVTPAVARVLECTKKQIYRDNERWQYKCTPLSRAGIAEELIDHVNRPRIYDDAASYWEGPRQRVTLFVGHDLPWPVPSPPTGGCGICSGVELPRNAYCILCDRSGIEWEIPLPTKSERPRQPADDGLAGGMGRSQPRARFPEGASGKGRARRKRT